MRAVNRAKGLNTKKIITLLETNLQPVKPRDEFVRGLRDRLTNSAGMRMLAERRRRMVTSVALAGVGLVGVLAWAAAVAAVGLHVAGRILSIGQGGAGVDRRSKGAKTV